MPERENHFSEAENDRHDVSNVLRDPRPIKEPKATEADINVEEGAPFIESIDPEATIGDYMQLNEEEERLAAETEGESEAEPAPAEEETAAPAESGLATSVVREQAHRARARFMNDLVLLDNEPALRKSAQTAADEAAPAPVLVEEEEDDDNEPEPLTFRNLIRPGRIKKPRFITRTTPDEAAEADGADEASVPVEEVVISEETTTPPDDDIMRSQEEVASDSADEDFLADELAEARAAQKKGQSICSDLHQLQELLEAGRAPFLHKTEVLVPREKTLRLIRSLTAICDVDPSYIDCASEDMLIDRLVSDHSEDDYKPLERARARARTIIQDATEQADTILADAKTLARQLLAETEAEIKEKFDAADEQIAVRMTTTKEESTRKLNEARSELTTSRQRSVEILSKYLEKAENDYQGYWERAENTVMASLEQSDQLLAKAADIYRKELATIHQDKEEIAEILEHLKKVKKRRPDTRSGK